MDLSAGAGNIQYHLRALPRADTAAAAFTIVDNRQTVFAHGNGMKGTHFYAGTKTKTAKVTLARSAVVFGYQVAVFDAGIIVQLGCIFFAAVAGDAGDLTQVGR